MLGYEVKDGSRRRKKLKKRDLTLDELTEIVRLVRESGMTYRDVAYQFDVKPHLVASLIRNEKLHNNSVASLKKKQVSKM